MMANLKAISGMNCSELLLTILLNNKFCYVPYLYKTYYSTGIGSHLATIILICAGKFALGNFCIHYKKKIP